MANIINPANINKIILAALEDYDRALIADSACRTEKRIVLANIRKDKKELNDRRDKGTVSNDEYAEKMALLEKRDESARNTFGARLAGYRKNREAALSVLNLPEDLEGAYRATLATGSLTSTKKTTETRKEGKKEVVVTFAPEKGFKPLLAEWLLANGLKKVNCKQSDSFAQSVVTLAGGGVKCKPEEGYIRARKKDELLDMIVRGIIKYCRQGGAIK